MKIALIVVLGGIVMVPPIAIAVLLFARFVLAPKNIFFTIVQEATAKVVVRAGQFRRCLLQFEGLTLDPDWNIVPGRETHILGGLRLYTLLWPLERIYTYKFRWTGLDVSGKIQYHPPEVIDYVLVKEDVYWGEVLDAEDSDRLPIDIDFLVRIRVVNPHKALFRIQNWLETVLNRIRPLIRAYVASLPYEELLTRRTEAGGDVWRALEETGRIAEFRNDYGIEIPTGGIDFAEIEPREDYRATTLIEWQAKEARRGIEVAAQAERSRISILGLRGLLGRILDRIGGKST